jgi:hypothetical protein
MKNTAGMHKNLLYGFLSNREVEKTSILKVSDFLLRF